LVVDTVPENQQAVQVEQVDPEAAVVATLVALELQQQVKETTVLLQMLVVRVLVAVAEVLEAPHQKELLVLEHLVILLGG
jgi:hypothetical protein